MKEPAKSNRKLAAILFADIVGYTAMMQSDEGKAMSKLQHYQKVLDKHLSNHQGELIKNYGDGSLCIFNSVLDALNCAKAIQIDLSKEPTVPLRIGLHLGDVMFRDDDVYSNDINIASRIESMGIPGSILVSKKVRDVIKNQRDILLPSLGLFEFKNVEEPMEVYALANEGFVVPKKEEIQGKFKEKVQVKRTNYVWYLLAFGVLAVCTWLWLKNKSANTLDITSTEQLESGKTPLSEAERNKRVAVMVFENKTGDEYLEDFGTMISDWITRGLMETGEADVISAANISTQIQQAGLGNVASPKLQSATGVGVTVQGRYYLQEDQLIIHADIGDASNGKVIHTLDLIQGQKSQMMSLLDNLTQQVLGYWAVKQFDRYAQNPPKYDAWLKLNAAEELSGYDDNKAIPKYWEAYQLDSTFNAPLLRLLNIYSNKRAYSKADSIVDIIRQKNLRLTAWEQNRLESTILREQGNYLRSAQLEEERYAMDSSDHSACYNSGVLYSRLNHLQKALDVWTSYDQRFIDPNSEIQWMPGWIANAHYRLGDYRNSLKTIKNYPYPKIFFNGAVTHLSLLIREGKFDQLQVQLETYLKSGVYLPFGKVNEREIYQAICNMLLLTDEEEQLTYYANEFAQWIAAHPDEGGLISEAYVANCLKDYQKVINLLSEGYSTNFRNPGILPAMLGIAYAKIGNREKANELMELVASLDYSNARYGGYEYYNQALIEAHLGNKARAVELLVDGLENGIPFQDNHFDQDGFLQPLIDYPTFEEFVKPKE